MGPVAARRDRAPGAQLARSGAPEHKTREAGQRRDIAMVALWTLETICGLVAFTAGWWQISLRDSSGTRVLGGALAAKNMCNADCSSVTATVLTLSFHFFLLQSVPSTRLHDGRSLAQK